MNKRDSQALALLTGRGKPGRPKYGNHRVVVDGLKFDSKREAARWRILTLCVPSGDITDLRRQVPYDLIVNGVKVGRYVADFVYRERDGSEVIEDAKGFKTPVYRLKRKLMKAVHGIDIREV